MKTFKYLAVALTLISLTACGSTEKTSTIETDNGNIEVISEVEVTSETETTPDIVESEDMTDLKLDNALLELDLVE